MSARVVNIVIPQGTDYSNTYFVETSNNTPVNLTGYSGIAKLAKHAKSSNKVNFNLTISSGNGSVSIAMTSGVTSQLKPGRHVYDVVLTDSSGIKSRLVQGTALVTEGVST